ncbi:MAG: TrbG/VirB9 family P-type conjugative transfer protein [Fusobacteriaceae bacterium]|jgi:type IV secretion system protein VirB9|nr:TrbG/VirB9 family P-type conjugative transfer protein [Fusobacteriaceae bacterium]
MKKLKFILFLFSLSSILLATKNESTNTNNPTQITQEMVDDSIRKYGINIYEETQAVEEIKSTYVDYSMKEPEIKSGLKDAKRNIATNFVYVENDMYRIYCRAGFITTIYLNPDEEIIYTAGGDTARWVIDQGTSGSEKGVRQVVVIKPFFTGIKSNLLINTSKRSYNFFLQAANDWYNPAVEFLYPKEAQKALENIKKNTIASTNVSLESLNYDYKWNKKKYYWSPREVFNDGSKTFVILNEAIKNREIPVLYIKDEQTGKLALVRYRMQDNVAVIDRLFEQATLKMGKKEITIKRKGSMVRNESDIYRIRR